MEIGDIRIIPVKGMKLIEKGDDLTGIILDRLGQQSAAIEESDVVVITSKVVSKAEGRIVPLSSVQPTRAAMALAKVAGRDPRTCELILRNCKKTWGVVGTGAAGVAFFEEHPDTFPIGRDKVHELFRKEPTMILAEMASGFIATDAGIDCSNVHGTENALLLPADANESCKRIRQEIREKTGKTVAVVISDTDIRYQRFGSVDQAIGSWGIETIATHFGQPDLYGKPKIGGIDGTVDMISNAASLVMGNTDLAVPVALVRGVQYRVVERGMDKIQVPPGKVAENVFRNIWLDLRKWFYNLVGF